MRYEFSKTYDQNKAKEYLNKLIKDGSKCEVKKIHPKRSLDANRYVHVLFRIWGKHFGYYMDEAKQTVKHALEYYTINDKGATIYAETSKMDSAELATFTEAFRDWSAMNGCYLCSSEEFLEEQIYFENLIEKRNLT